MLEKESQCKNVIDYDMKFFISSLVSALDPYQPSTFTVGGMIWESRADTMADMENVM